MKYLKRGLEHEAVEAGDFDVVLGTDGECGGVAMLMRSNDSSLFVPLTPSQARDLAQRLRGVATEAVRKQLSWSPPDASTNRYHPITRPVTILRAAFSWMRDGVSR